MPVGCVHPSVLDYSTTPARVDHQLAAAAVAQVALLGALADEVGLGPVGWLAGVALRPGLAVLLGGAARRAGSAALGPADLVTLARASLVGGVTALVADRLGGDGYPVATLVLLSSVALALDGVDGWVARRTGTVSALGARFDMEVDAFLVLVLSVHVAVLVTPWALVIGRMRYVFVAASWLLPWLSGALPHPVLREGRGRGCRGSCWWWRRGSSWRRWSRRRWSWPRWPRCSGRSARA